MAGLTLISFLYRWTWGRKDLDREMQFLAWENAIFCAWFRIAQSVKLYLFNGVNILTTLIKRKLLMDSKPWIRTVRTSRGHLLVERRTILYTFHFFRNKTFLFVKIENWNFQHLFDLEFRETSQNFSSFEQLLIIFGHVTKRI